MRIMGVDYGDARTGIAISDLTCTIPGSASVVPSRNREKAIADIVRLVEENEVGEIAVGLPRNMDGSEGGSADKIRAFAELLRPLTAAEIVFFDERVTTMAAHQILNLTDTRGAKRKSVVDTLSAEIILQNYLDRAKNT